MIAKFISIAFLAILSENFVLVKFLGICPFLGVSKKTSTAVGMGMAVTFVMVFASTLTYLTYYYVLVPIHAEYLQTLAFILVIAFLVQFVEMFVAKTVPSLYSALGIYLPLITTNCAVFPSRLSRRDLFRWRFWDFRECRFNKYGLGGRICFLIF